MSGRSAHFGDLSGLKWASSLGIPCISGNLDRLDIFHEFIEFRNLGSLETWNVSDALGMGKIAKYF